MSSNRCQIPHDTSFEHVGLAQLGCLPPEKRCHQKTWRGLSELVDGRPTQCATLPSTGRKTHRTSETMSTTETAEGEGA